MKKDIVVILLCAFILPSCIRESEMNDEVLYSLATIDYDKFRGSSFMRRTGIFRGVVGEIDDVPIVVGTRGRKYEIINDAKTYPLPDSLMNVENSYHEIAKRRFPLNSRELEMVREFIKIGILEMTVDTIGNVHGKVSPKICFEKPYSQEGVQALLESGYENLGNNFYIKYE